METQAIEKPIDVMEHMGLVHTCAGRLRGRGIEYEDLFQSGCIGLMKAVKGFDPGRGLCFSTYAVPVILGEMKRLFRDGQAVKIGRSCQELSRKAIRLRERFEAEHDRPPTVSELCEMTGSTPEQITEAMMAGQVPLSLTAPEEGGQLDIPAESEEDGLLERLGLRQAISTLSQEDKRLLLLRYRKGLTQSEAGKRLGMSQVQVSRREKKVLEYLRERF